MKNNRKKGRYTEKEADLIIYFMGFTWKDLFMTSATVLDSSLSS